MTAKDRIRPDAQLKDVIKNPKAKEVLSRHRLACFDCGGIGKEKLNHAARCHGLDVEKLIREIIDSTPSRR